MTAEQPLLSIRDLCVSFRTNKTDNQVLHDISFDIYPGETVAIVGESGSGKSTTMHAVMNLLPGTGKITRGSILWKGEELVGIARDQMEHLRGREIGLVPQDPMSNLNPVWSVGFQVEEAVRANGLAKTRAEVKKRAVKVLEQAGLDDAGRRMKQFPHQFSGGMKQRVLIGIGLSAEPDLLIADEPTSALDVTVQRVVLDHLQKLTQKMNTAVALITHDLGLAAERAEKIIVMYRGRIVEAGPSREILQYPTHPYTKRLVAAAPSLSSRRLRPGGASVSGATGVSVSGATGAAGEAAHAAASAGVATVSGGAQTRAATTSARAQAGVHTGVQGAAASEPSPRTSEKCAPEKRTMIEIKDLTKDYKIRKGVFGSELFRAVDSASFTIQRGETLALVGESGSGKSTIAKMILQLEKPTSGEIIIDGKNTSQLSKQGLFHLRRSLQPVFQDPYGSLDPLINIGNIIAEPLDIHRVGSRKERRQRVFELLDQVALPREMASRYPNELSGGQRQRIAVARGLALNPEMIVLDEAVSALDVLVQAQILDLLVQLQHDLQLTYLFITHDLAVVRMIADRVCVMQKGKIVEASTTEEVFTNPQREYTRNLLDAIPGASIELGLER